MLVQNSSLSPPKHSAAARLRRSTTRRDPEEIKFDSTHAREIELKRSRGEISCAECRRGGCAALCPNGSLATGQGTRFVLAATEHLHRRIAMMSERIRQLEDALAILQAKCSNDPHPLLSDGQIKSASEQDEDILFPEAEPSNPSDVVKAFGMLSVSDNGVSRFFGPTGGTEYLLFSDNNAATSPSRESKSPESTRESNSPSLSGEITRFSTAFPFTPMGPPNRVYELIESHLPSFDRACHLADTYISHAGWLFRAVSRQQLVGEMLPYFYKQTSGEQAAVSTADYSGPHDLALLLLTFAVGALVDLRQEPYNAEGEHYFQLSQAALCLLPVLERPSLVTIQALHLASIYIAMAGNEPGGGESSMELSWGLVALAGQLSYTIGLHRDSARWGLPEEIVLKRRISFWDLFVADAWQSLMTGRPPALSRQYIDCKFPVGEGKSCDSDEGEPDSDFEAWGFRFAVQCVAEVASRTLTAVAPSYDTIMDLDRKVREFPIPADAVALLEDLESPPDSEPPPVEASMQRFVLSHSREVILLYLHRSFFAQAIVDCPTNPLRSAYAHSFQTAYRSSCIILKVIRDHFALFPSLCSRFWVIWTFAFSAAVVFATVVTRGPKSHLAAAAIVQLDLAAELFEKAAKHSRRAAKALPILLKLREKAHYSLAAAQNDQNTGAVYNGALWNVKSEDDEDELDIFAGTTKLLAAKRPPRSPSQRSAQSQTLALPPEAASFEHETPIITPPTTIPIAPLNLPSPSADPWTTHHLTPHTFAPAYSTHQAPQPPYQPLAHGRPALPQPQQQLEATYAWDPQHTNLPPHQHQQYGSHMAQHYRSPQAPIPQDYQGHNQLYGALQRSKGCHIHMYPRRS
ncbi:putative transcriptional regulatory protein C1F7.11c [Grifola frondosa]|uniref:Putative transcriptional regulatory protein C1F7.11c n=1 Tax=Grifola frondosa TaxID=5627 RepID=A0A1C7MBK5_GRIFR|nr:putative transcriptional regulatory protein C1F7.11c [Grifola frondosa]